MSRKRNDQSRARQFARKAHWRQGGLCFWCKQPMTLDATGNSGVCEPRTMTADHVIPVWRGGQTRADNIVAACYGCNNSRNRETNQWGGLVLTSGDQRPSSPFADLREQLAAHYRGADN
jgi:5-methylcytosine-specific restriction endonuclease McrA